MRALLFILLFFFQMGWAASEPILLLYPDAPVPYQQVFDQLIAGIARTGGGPLYRRAITAASERAPIQRWLDTHQARDSTVVLLGPQALRLYEELKRADPSVLVGGINTLPGQTPWPGVSLVIDPDLYVRTLHDLLPDIRRVVVFYNAQDDPWIPWVKHAAEKVGLSIEPVAVTDTVSAVRQMTRVLETVDPSTTALWFAKNTLGLNTELIYPFVLEESWKRKIVVFSDTVSHAQRGFLFALYPDYTGVGAELGERIQQAATGPRGGLTLTRAARFALNGRTARHLGIALTPALIQRASPLFPQP